ncbi:hypothetical protein HA402_001023 [Bradysia odoriphaga]|nr:hypothetical protein HA402_001023 [Bradysia odoriphaga]
MDSPTRLEHLKKYGLKTLSKRKANPWCLEPLHVAWHNLINSNPTLYDAILQYKPVDLMDIRSLLKSIGLRYETNDIISFLDRKCITFKTDNKRNATAKKS